MVEIQLKDPKKETTEGSECSRFKISGLSVVQGFRDLGVGGFGAWDLKDLRLGRPAPSRTQAVYV